MNTLPMLALAALASGYAVAIDRLEGGFGTEATPTIMAYAASSGAEQQFPDVTVNGNLAVDQPYCGGDDLLAQTLAHDFAEQVVERRIGADGFVTELWASDVLGTWTVVHQKEDGISCIISSGTGWASESQADDVFELVAFSS